MQSATARAIPRVKGFLWRSRLRTERRAEDSCWDFAEGGSAARLRCAWRILRLRQCCHVAAKKVPDQKRRREVSRVR